MIIMIEYLYKNKIPKGCMKIMNTQDDKKIRYRLGQDGKHMFEIVLTPTEQINVVKNTESMNYDIEFRNKNDDTLICKGSMRQWWLLSDKQLEHQSLNVVGAILRFQKDQLTGSKDVLEEFVKIGADPRATTDPIMMKNNGSAFLYRTTAKEDGTYIISIHDADMETEDSLIISMDSEHPDTIKNTRSLIRLLDDKISETDLCIRLIENRLKTEPPKTPFTDKLLSESYDNKHQDDEHDRNDIIY